MTTGSERRWVGEMAEAYDRWLGPAVFQPFADQLADRLADEPTERVLELAAGTGCLTRAILAALPGSAVTATDLNQAMVEQGRAAVPAAAWEQADATDLPFDDRAFQAVCCQFGVMFFPDRSSTFAGIRRVIEPGGRFLANTWGRWEDHGFERPLLEVFDRIFADQPLTFLRSTPHGYHDPATIAADLEGGGFVVRSIEPVVARGTSTAADLAQGYCRGTPIRSEIEVRSDLETTIEQVTEGLVSVFGTGPVTVEMGALVIDATAP